MKNLYLYTLCISSLILTLNSCRIAVDVHHTHGEHEGHHEYYDDNSQHEKEKHSLCRKFLYAKAVENYDSQTIKDNYLNIEIDIEDYVQGTFDKPLRIEVLGKDQSDESYFTIKIINPYSDEIHYDFISFTSHPLFAIDQEESLVAGFISLRKRAASDPVKSEANERIQLYTDYEGNVVKLFFLGKNLPRHKHKPGDTEITNGHVMGHRIGDPRKFQ